MLNAAYTSHCKSESRLSPLLGLTEFGPMGSVSANTNSTDYVVFAHSSHNTEGQLLACPPSHSICLAACLFYSLRTFKFILCAHLLVNNVFRFSLSGIQPLMVYAGINCWPSKFTSTINVLLNMFQFSKTPGWLIGSEHCQHRTRIEKCREVRCKEH